MKKEPASVGDNLRTQEKEEKTLYIQLLRLMHFPVSATELLDARVDTGRDD